MDKKPHHITIKRWFNAGNTYFSANAYFSDCSEEKIIAYEYGYGSHGLEQAAKKLGELGYYDLPKDKKTGFLSYNMWQLLEKEGCTYEFVDVQRKKDL